MNISDRVDTVAHVIQVALTPVFLFTGVASLLGVLSTRLGRVADHVDAVSDRIETASPAERAKLEERLVYLRRRTHTLDAAVILAALGGMLTLASGLMLLIGGVRDNAGGSLFLAFGLALVLTVAALGCFLYEMLLSSRGIRSQCEASGGDAPRDNRPAEAAETDAGPASA